MANVTYIKRNVTKLTDLVCFDNYPSAKPSNIKGSYFFTEAKDPNI